MHIIDDWPRIKQIFRHSFSSSFHYAMATTNADGEPHLTPIGSLILKQPGQGFYFEEFTHQMPLNYKHSNKVCVMAVNSDRWFWIKSLFAGKFKELPAIRLYGTVGDCRLATADEIALWQRRIRRLRFTRGYQSMWKNMRQVRDISFSRVEAVEIGSMTRHL